MVELGLIPTGARLQVVSVRPGEADLLLTGDFGVKSETIRVGDARTFEVPPYKYTVRCTEVDDGRKGHLDWAMVDVDVFWKGW